MNISYILVVVVTVVALTSLGRQKNGKTRKRNEKEDCYRQLGYRQMIAIRSWRLPFVCPSIHLSNVAVRWRRRCQKERCCRQIRAAVFQFMRPLFFNHWCAHRWLAAVATSQCCCCERWKRNMPSKNKCHSLNENEHWFHFSIFHFISPHLILFQYLAIMTHCEQSNPQNDGGVITWAPLKRTIIWCSSRRWRWRKVVAHCQRADSRNGRIYSANKIVHPF